MSSKRFAVNRQKPGTVGILVKKIIDRQKVRARNNFDRWKALEKKLDRNFFEFFKGLTITACIPKRELHGLSVFKFRVL